MAKRALEPRQPALVPAASECDNRVMTRPPLAHALVAEFLGTALLVLLGDGAVATAILFDKAGDWMVITTGWALAVTISVYLTARVSGGHLNPAVTLALASRRDFPFAWVIPYILAQVAGAMVGGFVVYADYMGAIEKFEADRVITRGAMEMGKLAGTAAGGAGIFTTFPAHDSVWGNFFSEALGTAILLLGVRAVTDRRNCSPGHGFEPVLVGAVVWAIGLCLGLPTGYAINPARDFGPRVVACICGWGDSVFRSHNYYFWIPIVAPMIGGVLGIWTYDRLIAVSLPGNETADPPAEV